MRLGDALGSGDDDDEPGDAGDEVARAALALALAHAVRGATLEATAAEAACARGWRVAARAARARGLYSGCSWNISEMPTCEDADI